MKYEYAIQRTYGDGSRSVVMLDIKDCWGEEKSTEASDRFDEAVRFDETYWKNRDWSAVPSVHVVAIELLCRAVPDWSSIKQRHFKES